MTTTTAITLAIAVLGAVLGIINTLMQIDKSRIKIGVIPKIAFFVDDILVNSLLRPDATQGSPEERRLCVEVVNLSSFPITVNEVGFGKRILSRARHVLVPPLILDGKPWPRRLEPREAVIVYTERGVRFSPQPSPKRAYAATACGEVRYGTSKALKHFIKQSMSTKPA